MDKLVYMAMSGAKETLRAHGGQQPQPGQCQHHRLPRRPHGLPEPGGAGRGLTDPRVRHDSSVGWDSTTGNIAYTGVDLDVAVSGEGWIAVQGSDGREAYTRAGDLRVDATGQLLNGAGHLVLGDGGPLTRAAACTRSPSAATARSRSCRRASRPATMSTVGRIKLVNPPAGDARARRRRTVPHEVGRATRRPTPRCSSPAARSSPATSTSPKP